MFQTAVPLHRHDTTTTNVKPQKQTKHGKDSPNNSKPKCERRAAHRNEKR